MTDFTPALAAAFAFQSRACRYFGSDLTANLIDAIAEEAREQGALAALMAPFAALDEQGAAQAAVAIRFAGFAHASVLQGLAPDLARFYPPVTQPFEPLAVRAALARLARAEKMRFAHFLTSPPQTNEVGRSLALIGGFATIAAETGLPLRTFEIGASAGLNMNWDLYRYDVGVQGAFGDAASPVQIHGDWSGPLPPFAKLNGPLKAIEKRGCDISPINALDPEQALRLRAYCWADQARRVDALSAALELAKTYPPKVDMADAGQWVEEVVYPVAGSVSVLYHSIMWQYMPEPTQARIRSHMERVGAQATAEAPVAWLRLEPPTDVKQMPQVTLQSWPSGAVRKLADAHPHGAMVAWAP